jgi:hypothetical protein
VETGEESGGGDEADDVGGGWQGRSFCLFSESRAFHETILPFRFEDEDSL